MNEVEPFLDKVETVGMVSEPDFGHEVDFRTRTKWNRKRGNKVCTYARGNKELYQDLNRYILSTAVPAESFDYFINLRNKLQQCCKNTLIRKFEQPNTIEFLAAHTCKHKVCKVCNHQRAKALRRKYLHYFRKNEIVDTKTGEVFTREDFDFMHLTLTVPHSEKNGFRGKRFYADELIREFNWMRKKPFWKRRVFGGEFGVETTKNESGLHNHIHSLILVHKSKGSRNALYVEILKAWNRQTIDGNSTRPAFTADEIAAMRRGMKFLSEEQFNRVLAELDPRGATMIGLESLYTITPQGKKRYIDTAQEEDFIAGVLECIKYHFEPCALDKETGGMDWDLLAEILPQIHGKPLYRKFGGFHGVKELNVSEQDIDEVEETLEQTGRDHVTHPETGQPVEREEYEYYIVSASALYFNGEDMVPYLRRSAKRTALRDCLTLRDALISMMQRAIDGRARAQTAEHVAMEETIPDDDVFSIAA